MTTEPLPVPPEQQIQDLKAHLLARAIVADIALHSPSEASHAQSYEELLAALNAQIQEGRAAYQRTVAPSTYHYFEDSLRLLPLRLKSDWQVKSEPEAAELAAWIAADLLVDDPDDVAAEIAYWRKRFQTRVAEHLHLIYERAVDPLLSEDSPQTRLRRVLSGPAAIPDEYAATPEPPTAREGAGAEEHADPGEPAHDAEPGWEVVPQGMADERARALLSMTGSEDASALLQHPRIVAAAAEHEHDEGEDDEDDQEHAPTNIVEWVVTATLLEPVSAQEVAEAFSHQTGAKLEPATLYVVHARGGRSTYLREEDEEAISAVSIAFTYVTDDLEAGDEEDEDQDEALATGRTAADYQELLHATLEALRELGATEYSTSVTVEQAAQQEAALRAYKGMYGGTVGIYLRAEEGNPYEGKAIWDVMMSLGLRWGSFDWFHLENPDEDSGDDALFSIGTSTAPGFFLPEHIAQGSVYEDLCFQFVPARSVDPVAICEILERVVLYAQRRLGGSIEGEDGSEIDWASLRECAGRIVEILEKAGLRPGGPEAMLLM